MNNKRASETTGISTATILEDKESISLQEETDFFPTFKVVGSRSCSQWVKKIKNAIRDLASKSALFRCMPIKQKLTDKG